MAHETESSLFSFLLERIDRHYTKATRVEFQQRFSAAGFEKYLRLPFLNPPTRQLNNQTVSLSEIDFTKLSTLSITNHLPIPVKLEGSVAFSQPYSLQSLFADFTSIAHHHVRMEHYHKFPEYYAGVYASPRYFFFHGDGFCTLLSVLFQGLCLKLLGEKIEAMYCRTPDFLFSHGYCGYSDQQKTWYIDPDLKAIFNQREFPNFEPATWFINFFENISVQLFHEINDLERESKFYRFTRSHFNWLKTCDIRELSQPRSRYEVTRSLLLETVNSSSEIYDVWADDYPWKKNYRNAAGKHSKENFFFCQNIDQAQIFCLPPGAAFEVGISDPEVAGWIRQLQTIFFGRVPGRLRIPIKAQTDIEIVIPEIPWLITFRGSSTSIKINNTALQLNRIGNAAALGALGMGDLDRFESGLIKLDPLVVNSESDGELSIYFPINAAFWNSSLIKLSGPAGLTAVTHS